MKILNSRSYVAGLLRDRPGVPHQGQKELSRFLGHWHVPRMLEPDELFFRCLYRSEPRDPFALDVNVLNRNDPPWGGVRGDCFELMHRLSVVLAASGVYGEAPASTLALGSIDQLAGADVGVQPF